MGRVAGVALGIVLLAGGTACGERSEPTGSSVRLYPVRLTDARDHAVRLAERPERIATLAPSEKSILATMGARRRIVDPARGFFGPSGRLLLGRLRAVKPDLVVAPASNDAIERPLGKLGVPVYFAPQNSIRDVERGITQLGLLVAEPVAARLLVHRIEERRQLAVRRVATTRRVSVFVDTGFFTTVSDTSLIGDLVREARGRNVAGPSPEPGPFDLDRLRQLDPDVYLATSDSGTTLAQLRRDHRTRTLHAVRTGRFAIIAASLLEPGPQVGRALVEIARVLHPDAFR